MNKKFQCVPNIHLYVSQNKTILFDYTKPYYLKKNKNKNKKERKEKNH